MFRKFYQWLLRRSKKNNLDVTSRESTPIDEGKSHIHIKGLPIRLLVFQEISLVTSGHPTEQPLPILYTLSERHTEELSSLSAVTHRHLIRLYLPYRHFISKYSSTCGHKGERHEAKFKAAPYKTLDRTLTFADC